MGIISYKDNPPICNLDRPIIESEGTWWIAKVKPRQEKAFARDLLERGVGYYIPCYIKVTRRSDGKKRKSVLVLFPSYVPFISENPYPLLSFNRISTILPVQGQTKFKRQLNRIDVVNNSGIEIVPVSAGTYCIGDLVKVISGPLKGLVGRVIRNQSGVSIVLVVEGMGAASVTVSKYQLESICRKNLF